ncbi:PepSY-like domain-containing protein [Christiangramia fulva]|nr:PepSY-like domain-containing protein [Christiangramia fulva]
MKINKFLPGILLFAVLFQSCSENDNTVAPDLNAVAFSADAHVRTSTLPQSILDYITVNYPELTIIKAEVEDNENYEITLSDDTELIFNAQGEFLGIDDDNEDDFGDEHIQASALPQNILDFIHTNYPNINIEKAEMENNGNYEIKLENDLELIFDGHGNFLGQGQDENNDDQGEDHEDLSPNDLPQVIKDYITDNYPDNTIIEAEMDEEAYEITLNNGVELKFDQEGNFVSSEDGNGESEDEHESEND